MDLQRVDWDAASGALDADGFALVGPVLTDDECAQLRAGFDDDRRFRSTIDMARYRFGDGTYRYFGDPPAVVAELREAAYPPLAAIANRWQQRLGDERFPGRLDGLLARCRAAGQCRPTPLVLRYGPGGHNALHQDLYGEVAFPLQLAVALTAPGEDFTGGETVLVEQRPRAQPRATAITVPRGHALVFPNRHRPVGRGRVTVRHGVSTVHAGERVVLGVIFHDAK
jgi:hypothetical protein